MIRTPTERGASGRVSGAGAAQSGTDQTKVGGSMENAAVVGEAAPYPLIRGYFAFLNWLNKVIRVIGGALLVVMSVAVFGSVASRWISNLSWAWVDEGAVFIMVWVVVFGTSLAIEAKHMIAVEALATRFAPPARRVLKTAVGLTSMAFVVILTVAGWNMAQVAGMQYSPTLPWLSMFWVYLAIPVGGVLMFLNLLGNVIKLWTERGEQVSEVLE